MQISVIIATFNGCSRLRRSIPTLLAQTFPKQNYEIVVVVDGSTDGTLEFLQGIKTDCNLKILAQENRGQAAAINVGLREARGEIALFLDDDILCDPELVSQHAAANRDGMHCLAYGPVLSEVRAADPCVADWIASFSEGFFSGIEKCNQELGWYGTLASANSSAPRDLILSVGGIDESFGRQNDIEIGHRLIKAGYRFVYCPNALCKQIVTKTRSDIIRDAYENGIAEIQLLRKHPELRAKSSIPSLLGGSWRRCAMRALVNTGDFADIILRSLQRAFSVFRPLRTLAAFVFRIRRSVAHHRGLLAAVGSWSALKKEFGLRLPILMYHAVGPDRAGFDPWLTVSPRLFEKHLRWLKRHGYSTIRLEDWISYQCKGISLPDRPVLLTFDDAYQDTAEYAMPLLKKYGFTGTTFVVTSEIGGSNRWDWHLGLSEQKLITSDEVRTLSADGFEIGSHTMSHPDLRLLDPGGLTLEFGGSKEVLKGLTGCEVTSIAYPYGYYDARVREAARRHFSVGLTCDKGLSDCNTDPLSLKRATVVPRCTWNDIAMYTRFGYNPVLHARIYIERRLRALWGSRQSIESSEA